MLWMAPLAIAGMALFAWIGGELVMHLWNWLLPPLFGWRQVTFWQALGLLALCRILFGGLGTMNAASSRARRRVSERLGQMSPEDREVLREALRSRWGRGAPQDPKPEPEKP